VYTQYEQGWWEAACMWAMPSSDTDTELVSQTPDFQLNQVG
jgi:hypothetical protein